MRFTPRTLGSAAATVNSERWSPMRRRSEKPNLLHNQVTASGTDRYCNHLLREALIAAATDQPENGFFR
jgi:hypothetical protein